MTNAEKKKQHGQFFTKNSDYILKGLEPFIKNREITDPFAGSRDLMDWAKKHGAKKVRGFDVDPRFTDGKNVFLKDSINQPSSYKFVLTNPPYLHKNKANSEIKNRYFNGSNSLFEDLYQVSINTMMNSNEGIMIVPLNFLSAENSSKIRGIFFEKFEIIKLNIFAEQVFEDTTYNVISFYFRRKKRFSNKNEVPAVIFPKGKKIKLVLQGEFGWQFGGDFINRVKAAKNNLGVFRLTQKDLASGQHKLEMALQSIKDRRLFGVSREMKELIEKNILFLRAIDSKNGKKIQLEDIREYDIKGLVGKASSRNMAHLIFTENVSINKQEELMQEFNETLNKEREKYLSFFLTNFRDNNRKRISFDLAYKFINYLYHEKPEKQSVLF